MSICSDSNLGSNLMGQSPKRGRGSLEWVNSDRLSAITVSDFTSRGLERKSAEKSKHPRGIGNKSGHVEFSGKYILMDDNGMESIAFAGDELRHDSPPGIK
jgi:hypothetical protein